MFLSDVPAEYYYINTWSYIAIWTLANSRPSVGLKVVMFNVKITIASYILSALHIATLFHISKLKEIAS